VILDEQVTKRCQFSAFLTPRQKALPATLTRPPQETDEPVLLFEGELDVIPSTASAKDDEEIVDDPEAVVDDLEAVVDDPEGVVDDPEGVVDDPEAVVDDLEKSAEPQKKRARVRRSKEVLQNQVVENQQSLNKKMDQLISLVEEGNEIQEDRLDVDREQVKILGRIADLLQMIANK
jgi:hypothetical protein